MADLGIRAKSPVAHHPVVNLGPRPRGVFDGIFPGKPEGAFRPAAPAGLLLNIEEHEMRVRVLGIVSMLVVYGRDIPGNTFAHLLGVGPREGFSLLRGGFCWQCNNNPLTDAPLAPLGFFLSKGGGLRVRTARKPFLHHHTRRLWPGDITKMGRSLAGLCCTGFIRAPF
ncbi:hypothetical protein N9Y00_09710 [Tateyamaria sp.]|nr:hypothetical protein [Tateyamaria sp.]